MKKFFILILILFVSINLTFSSIVWSDQQQVSSKVIGLAKELNFQVLSQRLFKSDGLNLNILVSKSISKSKALHIAKRIHENFPGYILDVAIFDQKEAFQNRFNDNYPEAKYFKHYLVQMNVNPNTGFDEIRWVAKRR